MEASNIAGRKVYLDYLRVFAIFAVIILHVSAQNWYSTDMNGFDWQVFNFFNNIVRWCVPVFVMISGALFLNREIPLKKIYSKYVFRLAAAYAVWAVIYAGFSDGSILNRISQIISGHYHMWFIWMTAGLYICIPFIKLLIKDDKITRYFLLLAFIFAFLIPWLVTLTNDFAGGLVIKGVSILNKNINDMNIHIVLGYTSYFILGYCLAKTGLNKMQRGVIYVFGLGGGISAILLNLVVMFKTQQYSLHYSASFTINVLFESIAVFTWFKYKKYHFPKLYPFILKLSKYSFGAYLVHALIIEQLNDKFGLNTLSFNPVLAVTGIGIFVFICSFIISAILNQIPVVRKYMV